MELNIETRQVELEKLEPNPWNPNVMTDLVLQKERESIELYGFIDPITVRPHPTKRKRERGVLQIIDGEHRWRVATEMELVTVPVVVLDIDTVAAKKLTIILNETRGEADTLDLAKLLKDLSSSHASADELLQALPFTSRDLDELLAMASTTMPDYSGGELKVPEAGMRTLQFVVPQATADLWEQAKKRSDKVHGKADATKEAAAGIVFGRVLEDWMKA